MVYNALMKLTPTKRGAGFVLNLGTKVIPDKKKVQNKKACR